MDDYHDQDAALRAVSSVLKMSISPRDMSRVVASVGSERIDVAYKGHSGFITRKDAKDWDTSLGEIAKALGRGGRDHKVQPGKVHPQAWDWVRGEAIDPTEQRRLMGIGPSLLQEALAEGKMAEFYQSVIDVLVDRYGYNQADARRAVEKKGNAGIKMHGNNPKKVALHIAKGHK